MPLLYVCCVDVLVGSSLPLSQTLLIQQCYSFSQVNRLGKQFCNLQYEENPFTISYTFGNSAIEKALRSLTALEEGGR